MTQHKNNPAIVAGLLGAVVACTPAIALAAGERAQDSSLLDTPLVPFALGAVTGAALTGTVAIIAHAVRSRERETEAYFDFPEVMTPAAEAPLTLDDEAADASAAGLPAPSHVAPSHAEKSAAPSTEPRHGKAAPSVAAAAAARRAADDWRNTGAIDVLPVASQQSAPAPEAEPAPAATAAPAPAPARPASSGPAHVATDYTQVAENYVRRQTLKERMAARARGVADILADRLGGDRFEGLPIIERADGTVGDVGTSWWNARLGDSVRLVGDLSDQKSDVSADLSDLTVPGWMDDISQDAAATPDAAAIQAEREAEAARRAANDRSISIAHAVATVDQCSYPEHRTIDDLDASDDWETALKAMGEKIAQYGSAPVFADVVGGADTIDDPDTLEGPTGFIPFRTPAGHPEVVDTSTYVDYLIGDEFAQNKSKAARKSSRDYLRVIEGGSQALTGTSPLRRRGANRHASDKANVEYRPRHMAMPLSAKEA